MKPPFPKCDIIIVTYNSEAFIKKCLDALEVQTRAPHRVIIVDTGSKDTSYLEQRRLSTNIVVTFAEKESGFCRGNNIGYQYVSDHTDYVFFLNPDAFIAPDFIEKAIHFLEDPERREYGAVTGLTLGYAISEDAPTGKFDTTGVFRTFYGKWYDRGQGDRFDPQLYSKKQDLPAICGAVFFCRKKAIDEVLINRTQVFDPEFFMYKEDIDLSIRLRKKGWKLGYDPDLKAYHCRGWAGDRKKMSRKVRLHSARNELTIQARIRSPLGVLYSLLKYTCVLFFNM